MGIVASISPRWERYKGVSKWIRKWHHRLFHCPTWWDKKPAFICSVCGKHGKCYWDGNDIGGLTDVCDECTKKFEDYKERYYALDDSLIWNFVQENR